MEFNEDVLRICLFKKLNVEPLTFLPSHAKPNFGRGKGGALSLIAHSALFPASRFKCFCMKDASHRGTPRPARLVDVIGKYQGGGLNYKLIFRVTSTIRLPKEASSESEVMRH